MDAVIISVLFVFALVAALGAALGAVGALQVTRKTAGGVIHYVFYALVFGGSITVLTSGRNFSDGTFSRAAGVSGSIGTWSLRLVSIVIIICSLDQLIRYFAKSPKIDGIRASLMVTFLGFWLTSLVIPAHFAEHPAPYQLSWVYSLLLIAALLSLSGMTAEKAILACRNAMIFVCASSLLLAPVFPTLILQSDYTQGYLPGVPRLAGLASHAIGLATDATIAIWCLVAWPLRNKWLNIAAWCACLAAMFFAQSKTAWFSCLLCIPLLLAYRRPSPAGDNARARRLSVLPLAWAGAALVSVIAIGGYLFVGNGLTRLEDFFSSKQGMQLLTLTGRDRIWEVALQEWHKNPIFGYGLSLFDYDYRLQIHMINATDGHNEFIDSLARTGLIGEAGFVIYILALSWASWRFARATFGMSAALSLSILVRCISEIPLNVAVVGGYEAPHYLLVAVIAYGIHRERTASVERKAARQLEALRRTPVYQAAL